MTATPLRAVALLRMSTDKQVNSPARQREGFRAYCEQWGLTPVCECLEEAVSATHTDLADRAGVTELLALARKKRMDVVWCEEPSRLARKPEDYFAIRAALGRYGVAIVGPRDDPAQAHDTAIAEFTQGLLALLARFEARQLGERIHRAQRVAVASGKFRGGRLAYGLKWTGERYEVDTDAAAVVTTIFERYAAGHGMNTIARQLTDEGIASPRGNSWGLPAVRHVLRNSVYRGSVQYAGETYATDLPEVVPAATVAAVDVRLEQSGARPQRATNYATAALFAGVLRCPDCGRWLSPRVTLHYRNGERREYRNYACYYSRQAPVSCGWRHIISEKKLEAALVPALARLLREGAGRASVPEPRSAPRTNGHADKLQRERERVIALHVRGKLSEEEADALLDGIAKRQAELAATKSAPAGRKVTADELRGVLRVLERHWGRMSVAERRGTLQALVESIAPAVGDLGASVVVWRV